MTLVHLSDGYLLGMAGWLVAGAICFWWLLSLRRRWKGRTKRLRFVHAGLTLWMTCALLTAVELYFATVYDQTDSFNISNVSRKWFFLHVRQDERALLLENGRGTRYRDNEPFPEKLDPEQHHICFVGDSFTFGHGVPDVDDRFSNRVRSRLDRREPGRFVVSNLAMPGKDVKWVDRVHKELARNQRRVDTFVYVVCLNDIEALHADHDKFYGRINAKQSDFFLFRDTYFFNLLYLRARLFTVPEVKDYYSFVSEFYTGEPWRKMRAILDGLNARCKEHGTEFRIVIFPFLHNLQSGYRFEEAHRVLSTYCENANIPVLDLAPVLKPHAAEGLSVNRFDDHPNERAHQLAAEAILEWLTVKQPTSSSQSAKTGRDAAR